MKKLPAYTAGGVAMERTLLHPRLAVYEGLRQLAATNQADRSILCCICITWRHMRISLGCEQEKKNLRMLVRLTRSTRAKAGWFAALLYLFCVLAPGAALALGDAISCMPMAVSAAADNHDHAHSKHATSDVHMHAAAGDTEHQHHDKGSPAPCCAMLCLSAIATDLPAIAKPAQPKSVSISENHQRLPGKAPPLLYRPPNA